MSKILFFSPYARWTLHALYEITIAHSLKLRGNDTLFVLCDGVFKECDIHWAVTNPRKFDSCLECQKIVSSLFFETKMPYHWFSRYLNPEDFNLAKEWINNLSEQNIKNAFFEGKNFYEYIKSSLHSHFRAINLDLSNSTVKSTAKRYLFSSIIAYRGLKRLFDYYKPDALFLFNGRMSIPRIAFILARERNINVFTHERGFIHESIRINKNHIISSFEPILKGWETLKKFSLNEDQIKKSYGFLEDRRYGRKLNWKPFMKFSVLKGIETLNLKYKLTNYKSISTYFSSSEDEVRVILAERMKDKFLDQQELILNLINFYKKHPEHLLFIRVHPNTGLSSSATGKNIEQLNFFKNIEQELIKKNIQNIKVIFSDNDISSYSLIEISDLIIVYLSSIGLESACYGKNVISYRGAVYGNENFVNGVETISELKQLLSNSIAQPNKLKYNIEIAKKALRFFYFYFFQVSLPFKFVKMPDIHTGILNYNDVNQLAKGKDDILDKICDFVLDKESSLINYDDYSQKNNVKTEQKVVKRILEKINIQMKKGLINKNPLISVIIPCYNYGKYLRKAVRSIITQTFKNWELIIVNDGSTDDTKEVAESLIDRFKDFNISLINQENSGQPAISRNNGISIAKGKYILCLDADDMIKPTMLEECLKIAEIGYPLVYTSIEIYHKGKKEPPLIHWGRDYNFDILKYSNFIPTASIFLKKAWEDVGGYRTNVKGYEDWDFWIALGSKGYFGYRVAKPLFKYFEGKESLYASASKKDTLLKATIVYNNKQLYPTEVIEWAIAALNNEKWAFNFPKGLIPDSNLLRNYRKSLELL